MKKYTEIKEENIKILVDNFYQRVGKDELLSPVFNKVIKDWPPHLNKMYDFWSSVMLQTKKYKGNPLIKHQNLMPFDKSLFDRWLSLFAQTARELFEEDQALLFIDKSENIARSLKYMLYEYYTERVEKER